MPYFTVRGPVALPSAVVGSPVYAYKGAGAGEAAGNGLTFNLDIGTASSDRLIIVSAMVSAATALSSVVVNGVTLNIDIDNHATAKASAVASGLVTSGSGSQAVTITWASANFQDKIAHVWAATGLNSNTAKHTAFANRIGGAGGTATIDVTAGDFLFAGALSTTQPTFAGSTEAPVGDHNQASGVFNTRGSDWTIVSTNASFTIASTNVGDIGWSAASYR